MNFIFYVALVVVLSLQAESFPQRPQGFPPGRPSGPERQKFTASPPQGRPPCSKHQGSTPLKQQQVPPQQPSQQEPHPQQPQP